jgi:hypothetical protein
MEETPRYWNFPDTEYRFTEKLTRLCTSFHIDYQQLVELMSQFEIYISGGAAVWCMSSEPEYFGDIDFFINYNLDTVHSVISAFERFLQGYTKVAQFTELATSCTSCNSTANLSMNTPCGCTCCNACNKEKAQNTVFPETEIEFKVSCPRCNRPTDNIYLSTESLGLRIQNGHRTRRMLVEQNLRHYHKLAQIKYLVEFNYAGPVNNTTRKIQLIFCINPRVKSIKHFDLSCCSIYIAYDHMHQALVAKGLHKKLFDRKIAIWLQDIEEFSDHNVSRIVKYTERGFTVYVLKPQLAHENCREQTKKLQYLQLPKDITEYIVKPFFMLDTKYCGPNVKDVYTTLGINTPEGALIEDQDYHNRR